MSHRLNRIKSVAKKHSRSVVGAALIAATLSAPASAQVGWADPALDAALGTTVETFLAANSIPGVTIAASRDGKIVMNKAYGVSDLAGGDTMLTLHRTRMGSLSKMLTAMTFMKYMEDTRNAALMDQNVYGSNGILRIQDYPSFYSLMSEGWKRQTPVVATVISKVDDKVYTYYDDQTYSIGTTSDLDAYSGGTLPYSLPAGTTLQANDIAGMANVSGNVLTWYRDRTVSYGTYGDLDAGFYSTTQVIRPAGQSMDALVGIGASASGKIYSWWDDGTRAVGNYTNLAAESSDIDYSVAPGQDSYTIRSMAISKSDRIYTFYDDETVTRGSSLDLDRYRSAYATSLPGSIAAEPWPAWFGSITPRHIFSHSAGYQRGIDLTGATVLATGQRASQGGDSVLGMKKLHDYGLMSGRMLFSPGTSFSYSNHGGALAAFLLEDESGMPYKDLLDGTILDELGVYMGLAWDPIGPLDSEPHLDLNKNTGNPPNVVNCNCDLSFNFREASGYLTSTAIDYLRVMMAMDQVSAPDRKLLSDASIAQMEAAGPGGGYGIGWNIRDPAGWLDHGGSLRGGGAAVSRFKSGYVHLGIPMDDVTVVVMGNLDTPVRALAENIAMIISLANIDPDYDLY